MAWALTGARDRPKNIITSVYLSGDALQSVNQRLQGKLARIRAVEVRYEEFMTADASILVVAFGTVGRIAKTAIRKARQHGIRVGLLRPITLFPFPYARLQALAPQVSAILVVEMNAGQMVEDVRLGVGDQLPVGFFGHTGGVIPFPDEISDQIETMARSPSRRRVAPDAFWEASGIPQPT